MFKKDQDLTERSQVLLKNKEIKRLKADITQQLPLLKESELDSLLGDAKGQVMMIKLASRTILYTINGKPYFFDVQGRNNLFPTLLTCWLFPDCIRSLLIHGPVSKFILRGADLFVPGLANMNGKLLIIHKVLCVF